MKPRTEDLDKKIKELQKDIMETASDRPKEENIIEKLYYSHMNEDKENIKKK